MPDLSRKRERDRLPVRRDAYWQRLQEGAYLGFRRGPDTWHARIRDRSKKQQWKVLGEGEFDQAKRAAEEWFAQIRGTAVRASKRGTTRDALETYLADLRRAGRPEAASEAEGRFKLCVWKDPIAGLVLETATRDDFVEWRERLLPGRQPRTVNRHVGAIVAGLNRAYELGHVGNPRAWMLADLADDVEDAGETAVFINAGQREALIKAASPRAGQFLRGLELTGARPKELAAAKVKDFTGDALRLAHRKGRPPKLRVRATILDSVGVAFFGQMVKGLGADAPLFTEDGETPWRRHVWAREIRTAISVHNDKVKPENLIPVAASAYSFRHARISELLQLYGVDPLTVAQQTGTSLAMIEKHYMKFIPSALKDKLNGIKPKHAEARPND